jgi:hypothetical protein
LQIGRSTYLLTSPTFNGLPSFVMTGTWFSWYGKR